MNIKRVGLIVTALFSISLFFSITNLVPLSTTFAVLFFFLPLLFALQNNFTPIILSLLAMLGYFLAWTIIYDPLALINYNFYRRDGNVFITFMPLLLLGLLRFPMPVEGIVLRFHKFATYCNALVFAAYLMGFGIYMSLHDHCYRFLFLAHNAAGGFLANLVCLSFALWRKQRTASSAAFFFFNFLTLIKTASRGSLLGVCMALGTVYILKERHIKKVLFLSLIGLVILLSFAFPIWIKLGMPINYLHGRGLMEEDFENSNIRMSTAADRYIFLWPRAVLLWSQSPILGLGFGSYNDIPYKFQGIPYLFMVNTPETYTYDDAHSHHTYLNVLSETGLVGLVLLIIFLVQMRKFIITLDSPIKEALLLMFWNGVWSSMTEHRLFTPSQMLPFCIILGMSLSDQAAKMEDIKLLPPKKKALLRLRRPHQIFLWASRRKAIIR